MRGSASVLAVSSLVAILLLAGCESTPNPGASSAAPAAQTQAASRPRCEQREITGSHLRRCNDGSVGVVSGETLRERGMPTGTPAALPEGR